MKKVDMRNLDADSRNKNFKEVALGYTKEEALKEASRCLQCQNPRCVQGCPVGIEIPKFIKALQEDCVEEAYEIIQKSSSLPAICGRVCPQEKQCEAMCIKGFRGDAIAIGSLERYVADTCQNLKLNIPKKMLEKKIAVVGSGPSGLSCAGELAKNGYSVTIYEALHKAGGVLTYGIPNFRLPQEIVEHEINLLKQLGVQFVLDAVVGKSLTLNELKEQYDAVYLANGAGLPKFMGVENEHAKEVFSANEILTRINLMNSYDDAFLTPINKGKKVVVVGGGNVAMDAARSLKRLGCDVTILYRRGEEEMPARKTEINHAKEEGIQFLLFKQPTKINVDSSFHVTGITIENMEYIASEEGRKSVKAIEGSENTISCDMVVVAIGTSANRLVLTNSDLKTTEDGLILVEGNRTNKDGVFAGGDAVTGSETVILAMEAGKNAAREIMQYLND